MKNRTRATYTVLLALATMLAAGCSDSTRDSISEDINDGARSIKNAAEDATD